MVGGVLLAMVTGWSLAWVFMYIGTIAKSASSVRASSARMLFRIWPPLNRSQRKPGRIPQPIPSDSNWPVKVLASACTNPPSEKVG